MNFLMKWLGLGKRSSHVGLRPHREVDVAQPFDVAYDRVMHAMESVLGAHIYRDDRAARTIDAGFGLVNNERVRVSFLIVDAMHTRILIEAMFPVGSAIPERSRAVDALADALEAHA